ncbi:MAG TPA: type II secretion system F family protein [Candidatus Nanoarchaeia archaeon]|nr:type II secretion system F family protein [Candidatus Nanoarchaeia archaeon]
MLYHFLSRFYPQKVKQDYVNLLRYSHVKVNPLRFMGFILVCSLLLAAVLAFFTSAWFRIQLIVAFLSYFLMLQLLTYFILVLRSDAKSKFVESILPDVLQLMASNLRAGFTTDKALLLAARPEFGPFQDEINQVGKEITTGKDTGVALMNMSTRIKSERLAKTMSLIVSGLRAGGQLAALLEQTARNLRQEMLVDERIKANAMMYVIFIFVAIAVGAPALFGLSSFLVEVLTENIAGIDIPETAQASLPLTFTEVAISVDFVIRFAVIFLITSCVLGSLILGSISKGKEREGLKFLPVLIAISLAIFFASRYLMKNLLGGLFGF